MSQRRPIHGWIPAGLSLMLGAAHLQAHNLDQQDTAIAFDQATLDLMATRAGLGQSLIQSGDSIGLILKSTPGPGTVTGAGGYMTFYIPPGTQVEKTEYGRPTGTGGFAALPMKGPAIMAIGDGSVGSATTTALIGLTLGPNAAGVTAAAVNASGVHNGTLAGVYGDVGIFYSTDPKTAWQSFVNSGGYDRNPGTNDNLLTNNRGEARVPITKWDAEQLIGFGLSAPAAPIIDPNGRGNSPWGMAGVVPGPQSGYQWAFDRDYYLNNPGDPNRMKNSIVTGPWNRIQYPGSTIAKDQVGLKSTVLGFATTDASTLGSIVAPGSPLPPTLNWTDTSSPKAVRISYGGLVLGQSEYARVQLKILAAPGQPNSPFDANGCFFMNTDTFGGDAGGEQGGKDHLWRYYDPTTQTINACGMLQKQFAKTPLAPGEASYFELTVINTGTTPMTNVVITDPMPAGLAYVSATPAPTSTSPPTWTLGTVPSQGFARIRVNVTPTGTGTIFNTATMTSSAGTTTAMDSVDIGIRSVLDPTKSVTPSNAAPGATVTYTVTIHNIGTGANGTPLVLTDVLPAGFTYSGLVSAQLNGATAAPGVVAASATDPGKPTFTVSQAIQAGKSLVIRFTALISAGQSSGTYGNSVSMNYEGKVVTSGSLAPVTIGGAKIGDTVYRDWDGDGVQDAGEEGIPGVTVQLYNGAGTILLNTTTTDANGKYLFAGLIPGTYQVRVTAPVDYLQTADPDVTLDNRTNVTLSLNQEVMTADFGYRYNAASTNAAFIGDFVFSDNNNNHTQDAEESGIPSVTVNLYEDTNLNGVVDAGDLPVAAMATADGVTNDFDGDGEIDPPGFYVFAGLDPGLRYVVDVEASDPDILAFFGAASQQSTPDRVAVSGLTPGGVFDAADFGFFGIAPASVGDQVFLDNDGNGALGSGDTPLANVTVELYLDQDGDGFADPGELRATTVTDASGFYSFPLLGPASYIVKVLATDTDLPAGTVGTVAQYPVTLSPGDQVTTADFPYVRNLTKTADKASAAAAENITYAIRPYSPGSTMLANVQVTDPVPAGTTYNGSASPTPFSQPAIGGTGNVVWSLGNTTAASAGTGTTPAYNPSAQVRQTTAEVEDSFIDENNPTQNNGTNNALKTRPQTGNRKVSLLRITLPSLMASDVIDKAYVRVRVSAARTANHTLSLYRVTTPTTWVESSVNWNDPNGATAGDWTSAGGVFGTSDYDTTTSYGSYAAPQTVGKELEFDVTTLVRAWRDGTLTNNGMVLVAAGTDNGDVSLYSSEGGTAGTTPGPRLVLGISSSDTATNETVLDGFASANYALNIGTRNWLGGWFETGDNGLPNSGSIKIASSRLQVADTTAASIERAVDLSGASSATFTFNLASNSLDSPLDQIGVEASNNGGTSWVSLATYTQGSATGVQSFNLLSALGSVNERSRLRFIRLANGNKTGKFVAFDDVKVTFSTLAGAPTGTTMVANTALLTATRAVTVTMSATSSTATTVTPPTNLTTTLTGGATASKLSGPTPSSATADASGATFTWVYQLTAGSTPGTVRFSGQPTAPGGFSFGSASSQSVLVTPPLSFQVKVNTPAPSTFINNIATITDSNGLNATASAATATTASIGDLVWQDTNGDGAYDADGADNTLGTVDDEPGIVGIRVYVDTNNNGAYDVGEPNALTDNTGTYRIFGFAPGTYTARFDAATLPPGYLPTTPTSNTTALVAAQQYSNADFGLRAPAAGAASSEIGDTLWLDADEDGVVDASESAIPNVTVRLYYDADNSGTVNPGDLLVGTTTTDASGNYLFTGLNPGNFLVDVDESDPEFPAAVELVSGGTNGAGLHDVTLGSGVNLLTADFGYNYSGSIGDYVWYDLNGNIVQNDGIDGGPVANAVVTLYGDSNHNGELEAGEPILSFTITNGSGAYLFDNLPPGDYMVKVEEQEVLAPAGSPNAGLPGHMQASTGTTRGVTLAAGQDYTAADFGFLEVAKVEGHVFWDANSNGVLDPGETILPNITVTLTGTDLNGAPVNRTTTTDADGEYRFLPPTGTYVVTYDTADPDILAGLGTRTTPVSFLFSIASGNEVENLDFGLDDTGSVGDTIFANPNGNSTQDVGEPGLATVVVNLYANAGLTTLVDSKVTDGGGHYLFTGLADGTYYVRVDTSTLPAGYATTPTADPDAPANSISTAEVTGGGSDLSNDFGYASITPTFSVSGTIFEDLNTNGAPNVPTEALAGVTVTAAVDTNHDTIPDQVFTTLTDGNGFYIFTGIPSGANVVVTVDATTLGSPAYVQTVDPDATVDNSTTIPSIGANVTGRNFGYVEQFGSIAGTVVEGDGDGLAENGEPARGGVTVTLTYAGTDGIIGTGDDQVFVTTTNATGDYSFASLVPGNYTLTTAIPSGFQALADRDGTNPNSISLTLGVGQNAVDQDFEYIDIHTPGPKGFFYSSATGQIIPGGHISVSGPGTVTVLMNGVSGQYSFLTDGTLGTYSLGILPPPGWVLDPARPATGGSFDPTGLLDPYVLGSSEDGARPGYLADHSLGGNPWYVSFTLAPGDPQVINNNLPLIQTKPSTWTEWQYQNPLGGQNGPGQNPDGDFYTNLEEFAYCFPPSSGVNGCALELSVTQAGRIDARARRVPGLVGVTYTVEYIADLNASGAGGAGWTTITSITPVITSNGDGTVSAWYQDLESIVDLSGGKGFVRAVVTADLNNDGDTSDPGETARTEAMGWMDHTLRQACETLSLPFEDCVVLGAAVTSSDADSLDVAAALGSSTLGALLDDAQCYYAEVVSGAYEGHRFEIDAVASTAGELVLSTSNPRNTINPVPNLAGARIAVRAHKRLGEQFVAADYFAGTSVSDSDYVLVQDNGAWVTYFLLDVSGTPTWVTPGAGVADQSGVCLDPSQGLYVHRHQSSLQQTQMGHVRQTKFACPLPDTCVFASNPYPVGASVIARGLVNPSAASATPFTGAGSPGSADQVMLWAGDATLGMAFYDMRFYVKTSTRNYYTASGDSSLTDQNSVEIFHPLRSQMICPKVSHLDYVMPCPWIP